MNPPSRRPRGLHLSSWPSPVKRIPGKHVDARIPCFFPVLRQRAFNASGRFPRPVDNKLVSHDFGFAYGVLIHFAMPTGSLQFCTEFDPAQASKLYKLWNDLQGKQFLVPVIFWTSWGRTVRWILARAQFFSSEKPSSLKISARCHSLVQYHVCEIYPICSMYIHGAGIFTYITGWVCSAMQGESLVRAQRVCEGN